MLFHDREIAAIAVFDHACGGVVRSHHVKPAHLAFNDVLFGLGEIGVAQKLAGPQRQNVAGMIDIRLVVPAVMEHRLGQPLIAVVFQQVVDERHRRIGRNHAAAGELALEQADDRRRIRHRFQCARWARQIECRQQRYFCARQPARRCAVRGEDQPVGDVAVAQHGQHLSRIRRPRHTQKRDGRCKAHGRNSSRYDGEMICGIGVYRTGIPVHHCYHDRLGRSPQRKSGLSRPAAGKALRMFTGMAAKRVRFCAVPLGA